MKKFGAGLGVASLILMFSVLCLTVFALLTLSVAQRDRGYSEKLRDTVTSYYAADSRAVALTEALRRAELEGPLPSELDGLAILTDGAGTFGFLVPIDSRRALDVRLRLKAGTVTILSWCETEPEHWSPDDSLPVWKGE